MSTIASNSSIRALFRRSLFVMLTGYVLLLSYQAFSWPSAEDKVFPLLINALLILTLALVLLRWYFLDQEEKEVDLEPDDKQREKMIIALSVSAVLLIYLLGFVLGLFLFVSITVYILTRNRRLAVLTAAGFIILLYGSFFVFEVRIWRGLLRMWLESVIHIF
jgi:hypothetical protein